MAASPHQWRDDVLGAGDPSAKSRSMREWLLELDYADRMGWIGHAEHKAAMADLDRLGWVLSTSDMDADDADRAYGIEDAIIHDMRTQGLSCSPIGRAA